jgi:hypothetical protein
MLPPLSAAPPVYRRLLLMFGTLDLARTLQSEACPFTREERRVVAALAAGYSYRGIADLLGTSVDVAIERIRRVYYQLREMGFNRDLISVDNVAS